MNSTVFARFVLPFLQWFGFMILVAIAIDFALHKLELVFIGRYLGITGTIVIVVSFLYSLRKRKILRAGSPPKLLAIHEYMAWAGAVMILVHAGIHMNAILPWLAVLLLLISVGSGLVGKFLLKKANKHYREKLDSLVKEGMERSLAEKRLFFDAITVDAMKKWRVVHLPITLMLALLSLLHILSVLFLSA